MLKFYGTFFMGLQNQTVGANYSKSGANENWGVDMLWNLV